MTSPRAENNQRVLPSEPAIQEQEVISVQAHDELAARRRIAFVEGST